VPLSNCFTSRAVLLSLLLLCAAAGASQEGDRESLAGLLARYDRFPHAERIDQRRAEVLDHIVGLGPMQKVRGNWQLEESERLSGTLLSYTWRIIDGFSAAAVLADMVDEVSAREGASLLYACDARACGRSVQWANRVFGQRVLYGTEASQQYRVFALEEGGNRYRLVLYGSARTADRHYLHAELLTLSSREGLLDS
jgi:hypothetical protein